MGTFYLAEMEQNAESWQMAGELSASRRRVLLTVWLIRAWCIIQGNASFLRQSFVTTGFLVATDGSEKHLVKVKGVENYDLESRGQPALDRQLPPLLPGM